MVTYEEVRDFALTLPGIEESTSYGTPALKVRGKLLARLREEGILVVRVGADNQEALIAMEPDIYFITPHYAGSWAVLVHLDAIEEAAMRALIVETWRANAPKRLVASYDTQHVPIWEARPKGLQAIGPEILIEPYDQLVMDFRRHANYGMASICGSDYRGCGARS